MVKSKIDTARDEFDAKMLELAGEVERDTVSFPKHLKEPPMPEKSEPDTSPVAATLVRLESLLKNQGKTIEQLRSEIASPANLGLSMEILEQIKRKNALESANEKLFETLHRELRDYKDSFLFDSLQKPFVQDLLHLLGELNNIAAQLGGLPSTAPDGNAVVVLGNLKNVISLVGEILARLEVSEIPCLPGEMVDMHRHKTSGCEPAASRENDNQILSVQRPGYLWRDRVIRPVEVIVARWTPAHP